MSDFVLSAQQVSELIPHSGAMCLLGGVIAYDEQQLHCISQSHRANDNPLRANNQLHSINGIEYCGQAMALHNTLTDQAAGGKPRVGYFGSVSELSLQQTRLDTIQDDLHIFCECLMYDAKSAIYRFHIQAQQATVLQGRANIIIMEGRL